MLPKFLFDDGGVDVLWAYVPDPSHTSPLWLIRVPHLSAQVLVCAQEEEEEEEADRHVNNCLNLLHLQPYGRAE